MEFKEDARLEKISDKIMKGEPVVFHEAVEAINYQNSNPKKGVMEKITCFFKSIFT